MGSEGNVNGGEENGKKGREKERETERGDLLDGALCIEISFKSALASFSTFSFNHRN